MTWTSTWPWALAEIAILTSATWGPAAAWAEDEARQPAWLALEGPEIPQPGPETEPARSPAADADEPSARKLLLEAYAAGPSCQAAADYTRVIERCRKASALPASAEAVAYAGQLASWAYNRRGEVLARAGRDEAAFEDFAASVQFDPSRWRAYHNRGVSYALAGDRQRAIADFEQTMRLNPRYANAYYNCGEMRYDLGDFAEAIADYTRAIRLASDDVAAWNSRGHAFLRLNKFQEAVRDFSEALRRDPRYAAALANRGDVYCELGLYDKALADLEQSVKIDPQLGHGQLSLAWLLATCPDERLRDPERAVEVARLAVQLDVNGDPRYLDTLAAAHARAGNFGAAQKAIRQAIRLAPREEAARYRSRLALYDQLRPFEAAPAGVSNQQEAGPDAGRSADRRHDGPRFPALGR